MRESPAAGLNFQTHGRATDNTFPLVSLLTQNVSDTKRMYIIVQVAQFRRGEIANPSRIPKNPITPNTHVSPIARRESIY